MNMPSMCNTLKKLIFVFKTQNTRIPVKQYEGKDHCKDVPIQAHKKGGYMYTAAITHSKRRR